MTFSICIDSVFEDMDSLEALGSIIRGYFCNRQIRVLKFLTVFPVPISKCCLGIEYFPEKPPADGLKWLKAINTFY